MEKKTYTGSFELKSEDNGKPGEFKATFATFNVKDHDEDVTIPGAFINQEVVIEGWNHDYSLPVGKGRIDFDEEKAWIDGQFFLDTTAGNDHYKTVKQLKGVSEWSYTFAILDAERGMKDGEPVRILKSMDVTGVAPVTRGAGIDTRTESIKSKSSEDSNQEKDEADSGKSGEDSSGEAARALVIIQIEQIESEEFENE